MATTMLFLGAALVAARLFIVLFRPPRCMSLAIPLHGVPPLAWVMARAFRSGPSVIASAAPVLFIDLESDRHSPQELPVSEPSTAPLGTMLTRDAGRVAGAKGAVNVA